MNKKTNHTFIASRYYAFILSFLFIIFTGLNTRQVVAQNNERADTITISLLGTGTPVPSEKRFGYSTLIRIANKHFLFDAGRGAAIRLWQAGIPLGKIDAHFITHFHSDHTNGLPDLWLTGWIKTPYGQRQTPFKIFGPKGTKELTEGLERAYKTNNKIRLDDEKNPPEGIAFEAKDIEPGLIYDQDNIKISAFENDHGNVKPSYGYKIEYQGKQIVIAGDTKYSENVIKQSKQVDVLIHPVTQIPEKLLKENPNYQAIYDHLSSPEDAAKVFKKTQPKLAVFSHIGLNGNSTVKQLVDRVSKTYKGRLLVGEDLTHIQIGQDENDITIWHD